MGHRSRIGQREQDKHRRMLAPGQRLVDLLKREEVIAHVRNGVFDQLRWKRHELARIGYRSTMIHVILMHVMLGGGISDRKNECHENKGSEKNAHGYFFCSAGPVSRLAPPCLLLL